MRKDLGKKVEVTLASFDKAVKQSSTRQNDANGQQKQGEELDLDLTNLIAGEAEAGPVEKPSCRPWDYAAFTARLGTFTPLDWFSKPAFASPPMCARYGWVNTGCDTLSCKCCGARMHFRDATNGRKDNGNAAGDATEEVVAVVEPVSSSSFLSRLKSQHHDLCPWNGNACPLEFLQLPPMAREDSLAELVERLDSLVPVVAATALPEVSLPSSFEEACPGGLLTLAAKARAVLAVQSPRSANSGDASGTTTAAAAEAATPNSENERSLGGGSKRRRDGGNAAAAAAAAADTAADTAGGGCDHESLSAFGDEVVGVAVALAVFGWRAASPARAPADGDSSSNRLIGANAGCSSESPKRVTVTKRLACALCKRRVVTDNFLTLEVDEGPGSGASGSSAGGGDAAVSSPDCPGGSGRSRKRRRLSGGGTPLKRMDLAME
ncbi:unnamed protein product, partial [Hapterophycus canaliculatus]